MRKFLVIIIVLMCSFGFTPFLDTASDDTIVELENSVVISPNPAVSTTKVFTKNRGITVEKVRVYSMVNQKVIEVHNKQRNSFVELNVFNLRNGKYFVKVSLSNGEEKLATLIKTN